MYKDDKDDGKFTELVSIVLSELDYKIRDLKDFMKIV